MNVDVFMHCVNIDVQYVANKCDCVLDVIGMWVLQKTQNLKNERAQCQFLVVFYTI